MVDGIRIIHGNKSTIKLKTAEERLVLKNNKVSMSGNIYGTPQ